MSTMANPIVFARQAAEDYKNCYDTDLVSLIVYGSAAEGGDFDAKRSDINLLIILSDLTLPMIEKSKRVQEKWMKKRFSRPLFMDREYIDSSLDSFPIEFLALKAGYTVIWGEDVLKDLSIKDWNLRIQVERELKGKWLHLMREWPGAKQNSRFLKGLLHASMKDFSAIFQALLHLKNEPVPRHRKSLFSTVSQVYGLEENIFHQVMESVRSGKNNEMVTAFPAYVDTIRTLTKLVDHLPIKEQV